jgi:hypothetical protein
MSLGRVKTWIPGEVLTAADLNGEFNNVLDHPTSLISPSTGPINFNLQSHSNLLPSAISATSGSAGQVLTVAGGITAWAASPIANISRVSGLTGYVSSQIATMRANQYLMRSSDGNTAWVVTATSSFDTNIGTAGPTAGGRDVAGAFNSARAYWYAISTGAGSTAPAGLVSTAAPSVGPVLPANYSGWTFLGVSVYTSNSTSVAAPHRFQGSEIFYPDFNSAVPINAGAATALTAVALSTSIPQEEVRSFQVNVVQSVGTARTVISVDNATTYANTDLGGRTYVNVPLTSEQFYYQNSSAGGSSIIRIMSYRVSNGDV